MSQAHIGMKASEETRQKLSDSHKGINAGDNHPRFGTKHSEATRKKISDALQSDPTLKDRMDNLHRLLSKKVLCIETGIVYESIAQASKELGINDGNISLCCKGRKYRQTAGGYHWKYVEEENKNEQNFNL